MVGSKGAIEGTNETFQASKVIQKIRLGWVEVDVESQCVLRCICYKMIVHPTFQEGACLTMDKTNLAIFQLVRGAHHQDHVSVNACI